VSLETKPEKTIITVNGVRIGDEKVVAAMAGPCSVESEEQMEAVVSRLAKLGVKILRGGAYKPRTTPYAFQGLGEEGLKIMRKVADKYGMAVVTELLDIRDLELVNSTRTSSKSALVICKISLY
jgi:3-deoxy-D-arabino-heptulosonate 7-phosphate (DAHP) synthase